MAHKGRKKWKKIPRTILTNSHRWTVSRAQGRGHSSSEACEDSWCSCFLGTRWSTCNGLSRPQTGHGREGMHTALATPQTPSNTGAGLPPSEGLAIRAWLLPADAHAHKGTQAIHPPAAQPCRALGAPISPLASPLAPCVVRISTAQGAQGFAHHRAPIYTTQS